MTCYGWLFGILSTKSMWLIMVDWFCLMLLMMMMMMMTMTMMMMMMTMMVGSKDLL